ncbi:glycosyltransferase family 2 protein [Luteimonas sp. MC1750]|uniref:glycosyltransferase family 2 protein n=1 Tax=Luteimonas sp. MC1750 TaxID=2799326 RepID=UPI0018F0C1C5|nr:glycosyltransferase family 2 protein [Luteimonas sp. MC1750]MBJ6983445.1 glycosyltransferase family 2 protein [Luteimonas sp. MC1750]QQO06297.1 glycosyltransferase family 2 protein [Luteimonas sp. MC1750]
MNGTASARAPRRLELSPLHHLQALGAGRWRAVGHDPYFQAALPPECLSGGLLRITAHIEGDALERPCLYLDHGGGWSEAGRVELHPDGPGAWTAVVHAPALAGPVRFDPSETPGAFTLHALRAEPVDPAALLIELLDQEARGCPASAAAVMARARTLADGPGGASAACAWLLDGGARALGVSGDPYQAWIGEHDTLAPAALDALRPIASRLPVRPLLSLLLPLPDAHGAEAAACIDAVLAQACPDWELLLVGGAGARPLAAAALARSRRVRWIEGRADDAGAWNQALSAASGSHLMVLEGLPRLAPHALLAYSDALGRRPDTALAYADGDRLDADGRRFAPVFRPAWNFDLFLARDYIGVGAVFALERVRAVGGFRADHAPALAADLALRCLDATAPVLHLPLVLAHWPDAVPAVDAAAAGAARRGALADLLGERVAAVEPAWRDGARLRWPLPAQPPRASIVIPTRDRVDLLRQCVDSIIALSSYPDFEVLVVDNGSTGPDTLEYLATIASRPDVRVLRDERPFNYSALNNRAVAEATGSVVVLVNNDIEVLTPDWLDELVSQALRPGVGAVGAMLYYPDDTIQHAGVVLGLGGVAGHVYSRAPRGAAGEAGRAALVQEMSAVTAACLAIRKSVWDEVGGLDEQLQVAFNDVDFCLRLRAAGYRNVWTPHAELYHHESASRGSEDTEDKLRRFHSEVAFMVERWGAVLDDDPAYSPNLSLQHGAANTLASPPRSGLHAWLRHLGARAADPRHDTGRWTPR